MAFIKDFQHLKIQLEAIKSATDNFSDQNFIGGGGFGKVYKGEVSHSKGRSMAAFKCLDRKNGQGDVEFSKEIRTLSQYQHENLISLLGFCDGDQKILVYEYASKRSLDQHLGSPDLKWRQRLKICLEAAKALEYLHDPKGTHQRVLHCDIKSANILLDDNWIAKLSDLGLSKMGPANQQDTFLISNAAGTYMYCDPLYLETGLLSKESDVYSFGVVLFEVLHGRVCYEKIERRGVQILVPTWRQNYEEKKTVGLHISQDMDPSSLKIFSDIAYRCLSRSRKDRPTMAEVVKELDTALKIQEISDGEVQLVDYEEMVRTAKPPLKYGSKAALMIRLSKQGVLLNNGKTWFSINTKGEHCEMISIAECLIPNEIKSSRYKSEYGSRFPVGCYEQNNCRFTARVRTQFLSPLVTYTVNLVFKSYGGKHQTTDLRYKLEGKTGTSTPYVAYEREDGFHMVELYHLTSDCRSVPLEIVFYISKYSSILLEGIEFRPLEKVEDQLSEDEKDDMQPISDSDAYWEEKLPTDYQDIIKWSKDIVEWGTKKELYSTLSKGFLINDGQEWFSIDKDGKKCVMLSAATIIAGQKATSSTSWSLLESRFGEVVVTGSYDYIISGEIKAEVVSPQTTYASYLVYKLPEDDLPSYVRSAYDGGDGKRFGFRS